MFFNNVSVRRSKVSKDYPNGKYWLFLQHSSRDSPKFPKNAIPNNLCWFWDSFFSATKNLIPFNLVFIKISNLWKKSEKKIQGFFCVSKSGSIFQKCTVFNDSSRILSSSFSVTTGLTSSINVSHKKFFLENLSIENFLFFFTLHENPDSPFFPKSAIGFDLSRHANSYFSVTTVVLVSTKVSKSSSVFEQY